MAHRAKHLPSQLSGGQQQRVAVARAVAGEPVILLADEPTGNLDSKSGESVMELLHELYMTGATICMVTHDPRYARHADRSIHLFDGRVVDEPELAQPQPEPESRFRFTTQGSEPCLISLRNLEKSYPQGARAQLRAAAHHRSTSTPASSSRSWGRRAPASRSLLHILGMHDAAWSGEYDFLDQPVHRLIAEAAHGAPQAAHRLRVPELSPARQPDGLREPRRSRCPTANVGRKERQSMVADILDRFQIVGKKDLYPSQLSGGQQQLVGVARAVIANPQVILADEPTGNLHSAQGKEIMELFRRLNDGGHDDHSGHALGSERIVRLTRDSPARRLDRRRLSTRFQGSRFQRSRVRGARNHERKNLELWNLEPGTLEPGTLSWATRLTSGKARWP